MASLTEAIERKTAELGDDKEAKKKLVALTEQALTAIQEAKTQDAVDKALQAALASINQLQATPKEEPAPEEPKQPEEPNYDKAMASLTEAIERKTAELGDDKEAKKKLVALTEQALTAIQEAKTQDAVDKALQAALASINQLQATPKEEPAPEEPAQPEEPSKPEESKVDYYKAIADLTEAIEKKATELADDVAAQEKLVELGEQALAAIQEAKTQDAVERALQDALVSINKLQATPKEEPAPEKPAKPEEPSKPEEPAKPEEPTQPEVPSKPVEPKLDYDKAMASLSEAIKSKTAELGDDKEAKKKLVELAEQALAAIEEAKTQDAVDKALQDALTSINNLQATPKEEPTPEEPARPEEPSKPEEPAQPEEPSKPEEEVKHSTVPAEGDKVLVQTQPSLEVTTEPIAFNTVRRENAFLAKGKEQVVSDGKAGQVTTYVEVDGDTRKTVKVEREEAQDRVIEVGTYEGTSEPAGGVKELSISQPSLEVVEKPIRFKTVKQEDPTLPEGKTSVSQVGREGKERIITEVALDGSRTEKLSEVVEAAQDEIVLVGTKKVETGKTDPAIHEVPEFTGSVNGAEAASHELPEFAGGVNGEEAVIRGEDPEFTGGVNGAEAAINEVPEFTGGVNGAEATIHEIPEYKDMQSLVASQDKANQAPTNRQHSLPETGTKETVTLATLGAVGALLGLAATGKKKEDE